MLITGASSGIGAACAHAFAREGAEVMMAARREMNVTLPSYYLQTDVTDSKQVLQLVEKTLQRFGKIDVLVNCAGLGKAGSFHLQPWDEISRGLSTNLAGAMAVSHAVIPHMLGRGSGLIVNVSSVIGKRAVPGWASYSAGKFGLWGFSESLRLELRESGIQICHFCPRITKTSFGNSGPRADSPEVVAEALLSAVLSRKREYIISLAERVLIKSWLWFPELTRWLLDLRR